MGIFDIYLPIAGIHFNVLILLAIGFAVGVLGGFFGVGGAWVVTPALNIFGFNMSWPTSSASPSWPPPSTARWATWTSSWA
jgi:uncharacterized membrane protein YfcA